jgi:aspartyl aminopeptidase
MDKAKFNSSLCDFLAKAKTPFHAVSEMVDALSLAGFSRLSEVDEWQLEAGRKYFVTLNDSAIIAFVNGTITPAEGGLRMAGAHTDSPCLMVKPSPEKVQNGYIQLGVQVYGGALLNPWFDRDLSLAGRVSFLDGDGALKSSLIDFERSVAYIPSLAIHLDKTANSERTINAQTDVVPILCQLNDAEVFSFRELLASRLHEQYPEQKVSEVLDYELAFYDTQAAAIVGLNDEFLASARLDNLLSCFLGMRALIESGTEQSALLVCNDHEEVGSQSTSGANGPFLESVLRRIGAEGGPHAALVDRSMMISVDNAHGVHPNFSDRHDDNHGPLLNAGPVIKVNANQRYATNSETSSMFRMLCRQVDASVQSFVVRNDMSCGSTIGPITAGITGIRTLDVGVPTFGMHSVRELAGTDDAFDLYRVLTAFFDYQGTVAAR